MGLDSTDPVLVDLLTVAVLAFVGTRLFTGARLVARPDVRAHVVTVARGIRLRHALLGPVVLALVITAAGLLVQVPGLDWGWWTEIGGGGNPVIGVTDQTSGSPLEWIIPAVFLVMLLPALPLFAEREERMFRLGAERWSTGRRIWRGIQFGLVHAIIGIPIGVALALSIGGWYFTVMYLRAWRRTHDPEAAVLESTRAHFTYNLEVLLLVAVALVFGV
jgi:hypothetical protein